MRFLKIVAWIRRRVPYGVLKNVACSIEGRVERRIARSRPLFTIADLIRREGREPGGKPCAQVWVVRWSKDTVHKKYPPSPWRSYAMEYRILVPRI